MRLSSRALSAAAVAGLLLVAACGTQPTSPTAPFAEAEQMASTVEFLGEEELSDDQLAEEAGYSLMAVNRSNVVLVSKQIARAAFEKGKHEIKARVRTGRFHARVVDTSGRPVAGAVVELRGYGDAVVRRTNGGGVVQIARLKAGAYSVTVRKHGYVVASASVSITSAKLFKVQVTLRPLYPTPSPSTKPSVKPSPSPAPSVAPSVAPSAEPSVAPSVEPSVAPSVEPSAEPSPVPSIEPSVLPPS